MQRNLKLFTDTKTQLKILLLSFTLCFPLTPCSSEYFQVCNSEFYIDLCRFGTDKNGLCLFAAKKNQNAHKENYFLYL